MSAVAAGSQFSLALKNDGTVVAWGCPFHYGQCTVPSDLSDVTAIAAGHFHALALKGNGTVVTWGCGGGFDYGQCTVPSDLSGVTAVSAGVVHSLALKSDGTVVAWGCGAGYDHGECSVPNSLTGVTAIAAGGLHSLALKSDGTVVAWGCGGGFDYGQCSVPNGLSGVTAIAAAHTQSLALKSDGTVVSWGCSAFDYGQCNVPNGLTGVTAIAAGYGHSLALKSDGTVVGWGCSTEWNFGQCTPPHGLIGVTGISAGDFHSLAVATWFDQTISFEPIPDRTWNSPGFTLHAQASSGLPVSFSASGRCFLISGVYVWLTGAGSCTITASQAGGLNYNPAPDVSRTFALGKAQQSITFAPLEDKTFGDPDFSVGPSSSSGLHVSLAAGGTCKVADAIVHLTGPGSCTLTASQAGDANYFPAPDVSQSFTIEERAGKAPPARCRVPRVVGKRLASAKVMIARRNCRTGTIAYAHSRTRKRGIVISQSRRAGKVLPAGSRINLVVRRGLAKA